MSGAVVARGPPDRWCSDHLFALKRSSRQVGKKRHLKILRPSVALPFNNNLLLACVASKRYRRLPEGTLRSATAACVAAVAAAAGVSTASAHSHLQISSRPVLSIVSLSCSVAVSCGDITVSREHCSDLLLRESSLALLPSAHPSTARERCRSTTQRPRPVPLNTATAAAAAAATGAVGSPRLSPAARSASTPAHVGRAAAAHRRTRWTPLARLAPPAPRTAPRWRGRTTAWMELQAGGSTQARSPLPALTVAGSGEAGSGEAGSGEVG